MTGDREPIEHELKTWQSYFHAIADGTKTFEIRRDDRGFRVGDTLRLRETEYGSGNYTGREERRLITQILRYESDLGLMDGYAILSLKPFTPHPTGSEEFAGQLEYLGVPAPWRLDDEERGLILAANGEMACAAGFDHMPLPDEDRTALAMYIILAVNTLAGFKAEIP